MITIHQPKVVEQCNKSRLTADIDIDGKRKSLWHEVDAEYGKYLCHERSDAFLVGALQFAMCNRHDITCIAPVTEELLFNITTYFLPTLSKYGSFLYHPRIIAPYASEIIENYGGVGTGISCGIDSFHAVATHWQPKDGFVPKLTHLCINNMCFETESFQNYGAYNAKKDIYARSEQVAKLLNLPLISSDSNYIEVFGPYVRPNYSVPINAVFSILTMQKLFKTYLFGSGYDFGQFQMPDSPDVDSAKYDLLSMNCFSTSQIRIYSEGGARDRIEKTATVADFPLAWKYIHVCWNEGDNCGTCGKCRRTLLTLDVLGKLEEFRESLPVDYYRSHLDEYFKWLNNGMTGGNIYCWDIYTRMRQRGMYTEKLNKFGFDVVKRTLLSDEELNKNTYQPLRLLQKRFPNMAQKFIIFCLKPFLRLFLPLEYLIMFESDPSNFFAVSTKKLPGRLFVAFLSRIGPSPERTDYQSVFVKKAHSV